MNHRVPNYKLDDVYSVPPSSTLTRKSSMAADEVMELLWLNGSLNGSRGGSSSHASPVPPPAAPEIQSAVEEAAAEAAQDHLFMQEDEMASWLHYPIQDTNFEPDISDYFNPPPPTPATELPSPATAPLPELNISTSIELKIKPQDETVSLPTGAAARPPVPPPSLPVPPRRRNNFVHFTKLPAAAAMKESRPPLSLDKAMKESTVMDSSDTPKLSQVGSNELPKVECGKNEGGGTSTLAGGSTSTIHSDDLTSASGESGGSMTDCVETSPPTLVIGMNREEETDGVKSKDRKRKGRGGGAVDESQSLSNEFESGKEKKQEQASTSTKRSRAAEVHNLSERKRRDRINEKMKSLQEIVPCCNKTDKASMLDDAIEYMKTLQSQIQMMSMGYGMVPMTYPGVQPYMPAMGMSVSHPLVPYPPMLPVSTMPIPAPGVPMHMPVVHDQSGVQPSNPVNPAMISVPRHNPHPNFTNPYLQYLGPQHCQVMIPQNQAATEPNNAKPSASKEDVKC